MNVTVRTLTGSSFSLEVPAKGSISAIRSLLQDHLSTSGSSLRIIFKNQLLTDSQSIESVGITEGSALHVMQMITAGFDIFVKTLTGKTLVIGVKKSDSIRDVKEQIHDKEGIPLDQQVLTFAERELSDSETVEDCGISIEATLFLSLVCRKTAVSDAVGKLQEESKALVPSWKVIIHTFACETFPITINSQQVSGQRVKLAIHTSRSIPVDKQRLYHRTQEVSDTTNLDLSQKTELLLITPNDCIKVQPPAEQSLAVKLTDGLAVSAIVHSLEVIKGWKRSDFQLILNNRILTDEREVLVSLTRVSELRVSMKWKLYVRDLAGRVCILHVFSADSVDLLRQKLASKLKLKVSNCGFLFKGKLLQGTNLAAVQGLGPMANVDFEDFFPKST